MFKVKETYLGDDAPEGYTGVGGTFFFTLTAGEQSGTGMFEITYRQYWEEGNGMITYSIPIHVN